MKKFIQQFTLRYYYLWFSLALLIIFSPLLHQFWVNQNLSYLLIIFLGVLIYVLQAYSINSQFPFFRSISQVLIYKKQPALSFIYIFNNVILYLIAILVIVKLAMPLLTPLLTRLINENILKFVLPVVIIFISGLFQPKRDRHVLGSIFLLSVILLILMFKSPQNPTSQIYPISPVMYLPILLWLMSENFRLNKKHAAFNLSFITKIILPLILVLILIFLLGLKLSAMCLSLRLDQHSVNPQNLLIFTAIAYSVFLTTNFFIKNSRLSLDTMGVEKFIPTSISKYSHWLIILGTVVLFLVLQFFDTTILIVNLLICSFMIKLMITGICSLMFRRPSRKKSFVLPLYPIFPLICTIIPAAVIITAKLSILFLPFILVPWLIYEIFSKRTFLKSFYQKDVANIQDIPLPREYKILVPLANPSTAEYLIEIAKVIARHKQAEIIFLKVNAPYPPQDYKKNIENINSIIQTQFSTPEIPYLNISRRSSSIVEGILNTIVDERINLVILGWSEQNGKLSNILQKLLEDATCDVLVVKSGEENISQIETVLLPWEKEKSPPWISLAEAIKSYTGGNIKTIKVYTGGKPHSISSKIITQRITENVDTKTLIVIGNPPQGIFERLSLGSISIQLAQSLNNPIFISRPFPGYIKYFLRRIVIGLDKLLPSVEGTEKYDFYRRLAVGARPSIDYYIMVFLSSIIATLGLLLNSPAVIIGAMLVAPLMTPLIATSLGIATGNRTILFKAIEASLKGLILAVIISYLMTWLFPPESIGVEILSRTKPSLLDLLIAMASGMAGAYALAHGSVRAALPGVAIAAALMPPACVIGISLAQSQGNNAFGALLLFTANLIGISFAAGVILLFLGLHPEHREHYRKTTTTIISSLLTLLSIGIILFFIGRSSLNQRNFQNNVISDLENFIDKESYQLVDYDVEFKNPDSVFIFSTISGIQEPNRGLAINLQDELSLKYNRIFIIRIRYLKEISSPP